MGLFTAIATLPLAPVRGVAWVAQQVAEEAERELYSEERIRRDLLQAEIDRDAGLIDEQEHKRRADALVRQLAEARRAEAWGATAAAPGKEPEHG
jgi:hypothetical protein